MNNEEYRYGSAAFATQKDLQKAGMFEQEANSLLVGFHGKKPLYYSGMGGLLMVAGARSGKLRDVLAYNLCSGTCLSTLVVLDMKGELAAISQDQTPDGKFCIYWNPPGLHGLPQHRINPLDYLHSDNPSLVSHLKVFCENMIPDSGGSNSAYFEGRAREFLEGICLAIIERDGVLTYPALYAVLNLMPAGDEAWHDFGYDMHCSRFAIVRRIEEEIAAARENPEGSGFQGIMGELLRAFSSLSDPQLMNAVSPPYDFSLKQLCESHQAYQFYLNIPEQFITPWAAIIKSFFVAAMIYKSEHPGAPRQTWILDECAQLKKFPLVVKMFTYGAGIGIRPWAIYQSTTQMKETGPGADTIITSSAALRSYFGVRDFDTARLISQMIGHETLVYEDHMRTLQARHAKQQAIQAMMSGADPITAGINYKHQSRQQAMPAKQQRLLRTPDEILNMGPHKQFIFTDALPGPVYGERKAYYEQRFMAGRYHPNPFYPPLDTVKVKTRFGYRYRKVIHTDVPDTYAHYPQYSHGRYSYVEQNP